MAYNEDLVDRTREIISKTHSDVVEKKMFGGLCFMVNEKMCVGVQKDQLMVRINSDNYEILLEKEGSNPMEFTGKVMKGYLFIDAEVLESAKKLSFWINEALAFNVIAKQSKKVKKNN